LLLLADQAERPRPGALVLAPGSELSAAEPGALAAAAGPAPSAATPPRSMTNLNPSSFGLAERVSLNKGLLRWARKPWPSSPTYAVVKQTSFRPLVLVPRTRLRPLGRAGLETGTQASRRPTAIRAGGITSCSGCRPCGSAACWIGLALGPRQALGAERLLDGRAIRRGLTRKKSLEIRFQPVQRPPVGCRKCATAWILSQAARWPPPRWPGQSSRL